MLREAGRVRGGLLGFVLRVEFDFGGLWRRSLESRLFAVASLAHDESSDDAAAADDEYDDDNDGDQENAGRSTFLRLFRGA